MDVIFLSPLKDIKEEITVKGLGEEKIDAEVASDKPGTPFILVPNFYKLPREIDGMGLYHSKLTDEEMRDFEKEAQLMGLKWWAAPSAREVWKEVFASIGEDPLAKVAVEQNVKCEVQKLEDGKMVSTMVSIEVAKADYNVKDQDLVKEVLFKSDAALPHKFFDGSK